LGFEQIRFIMVVEELRPPKIVDYDINDCAKLEDNDDARNTLMAHTELIVRRLLMHNSEPAVLFVNVAVTHQGSGQLKPFCNMHGTCYSIGDIRSPILNQYGVQQYGGLIFHAPLCPKFGNVQASVVIH
jgi:hypothetical protein